VKDEWDNDVLHVRYDSQQITVRQLREKIAQEGFESVVKENRN